MKKFIQKKDVKVNIKMHKINKVDDFTRKRYLIIELLDYLEANKIKITNRKEFTDGIDMLNKTFEEDK